MSGIKGDTTPDKRFPARNPLEGVGCFKDVPTRKYIIIKGDKELRFEHVQGRSQSLFPFNDFGIDQCRLPILDNNQEWGQKVDLYIDDLKEALSSNGLETEVKLGNCLCKSVWCDKCYKYYYVPRYKDQIKKFDFRKTRHVVLTTDRNKFNDNIDALETITGGKRLYAFLRKLERGKKKKVGNEWIWEFEPVRFSNALAVLEFHKDGFPHWHFLLEVEKEGKEGMLGLERLLWAWTYGMVREEYFRDENHWKNLAGYFAEKGYFEKGKEYQTRLPDNVKENMNRRVRRITQYYSRKGKGIDEEIKPDITEDEAIKEIKKQSEQIAKDQIEEKEKKDFVGYKTILGKCGQKTFIRAIINRKNVDMLVPVPFKVLKDLFKPVYKPLEGYICTATVESILMLEECAEWVRWDKDELRGYLYDDTEDYEEEIETLETESVTVD